MAAHKCTDDVRPMLEKARGVAGKTPALPVYDGASNFEEHRNMYAARSLTWKESRHEPRVRLDGGLKKEDSAILAGLRVYHSHVRPHLALDGGTPGDAAGIHVEDGNPWLAIIESAARFEASVAASPPRWPAKF